MESSRQHGPVRPEQTTGPSVPGQRAAPGVPAVGAPRAGRGWSRFRVFLAVAAGSLALLCLGGVGLGYVLYDQATEPDRSAPDIAVSNYLRALFVDRDDGRAAIHQCASDIELAGIKGLREEIEAQEKRLGTAIAVSWGELTVARDSEAEVSVTTSIRRTATVDGVTQSVADDWRFVVVDKGGWRVCEAQMLP